MDKSSNFLVFHCKILNLKFLPIIGMTKFELDKNVEKNSNPSFLNFLFKLIFHKFDTPFVNF
jgi:hypothetical protein